MEAEEQERTQLWRRAGCPGVGGQLFLSHLEPGAAENPPTPRCRGGPWLWGWPPGGPGSQGHVPAGNPEPDIGTRASSWAGKARKTSWRRWQRGLEAGHAVSVPFAQTACQPACSIPVTPLVLAVPQPGSQHQPPDILQEPPWAPGCSSCCPPPPYLPPPPPGLWGGRELHAGETACGESRCRPRARGLAVNGLPILPQPRPPPSARPSRARRQRCPPSGTLPAPPGSSVTSCSSVCSSLRLFRLRRASHCEPRGREPGTPKESI